MIHSLQRRTNHKYFRALTLGLSQFHTCWSEGTPNASSFPEQMQEGARKEEQPSVPCYPGLQAVRTLPGGPEGMSFWGS